MFSWQTLEPSSGTTETPNPTQSFISTIASSKSKYPLPPQTRNSNPHKYVQVQLAEQLIYAYSFYQGTICVWNSLPANVLIDWLIENFI